MAAALSPGRKTRPFSLLTSHSLLLTFTFSLKILARLPQPGRGAGGGQQLEAQPAQFPGHGHHRVLVAVADADKNVVANLVLTSNHATELDSAVVTFDQFVKVDNAESTALAFNAINQPGGIRSGFSFVEDAGNGAFTALVENTDFFIDHVNDRVYFMSDQSTLNDILLYASSN